MICEPSEQGGLIYGPICDRLLRVFIGAILLAGGCASKPKPFEAPNASFSVDQFTGTVLSGPQTTFNANQQVQDALIVKVNVIAIDRIPADAMQPASSMARLITVTQSGLPVVPVAELTRPARIAMGDDAGKFVQDLQSKKLGQTAEMQSFQAALAPGVTCIFRSDDPASAKPRGISLAVSNSIAGPNGSAMLRYALIIQDQITPKKDANSKNAEESTVSNEDRPADMGAITQRETVIMDDQPLASGNAALVAPFRFTNSSTQAVAFVVEVSKGSQDQAYADVFQRAQDALKNSAQSASKRPDFGPLQADEYSGYDRALRAAKEPKTRRAAIVYLANQANAPLCADVALASDDATLKILSDRISRQLAASPTRSTQNIGWMLDLSAFQLLSELQSNNKLPQELNAVLTIHCGEAGRHASSLEEIVKGLSGRQDFQNRLLAENLIYLEDSSPASRVRAYDWLHALGRAPAGYDPLGDNKQRREALDRAANPTTQQVQP
jgi:hypothetical protein